jgi:hypothetical protein
VVAARASVSNSRGDDSFCATASALGGQTALLFGWRPDDFWNATPAELGAIMRAFQAKIDTSAGGDVLKALMEQFPDG